MNQGKYYTVKIYSNEENSWFKQEEYEKVFSFLQEKGAKWTSVTKGVIGYGKNRVIQKEKFFTLTKKMPVVIETIVSADQLATFLAGLKRVIDAGAVFTIPVQLMWDQ
ncbi:MAG: DUF190 domain-containing protein [Sporolactobacillus sp.]|jgi:PII-like signaling protein|nr:DUF190 domain-containing protein [Sporolactobacillus sp.]